MHILQPKHIKLNKKEVQDLIEKFNISMSQLPKIKKEDPSLPDGCEAGDVVKIERKLNSREEIYFRAVI